MSSLKQDMKLLREDFGISPILTEDIQKSPEMAAGVIKFFGRSMYIFNSIPIFLGVVCGIYGALNLVGGFSLFNLLLVLVGAGLFWFFSRTLLVQIRAYSQMRLIAEKHGLIIPSRQCGHD